MDSLNLVAATSSISRETHVVITVRDLARQVTSEWQERIKNGSTANFRRFQRRIEGQIEGNDFSSLFWRYQRITGVIDRWAADLPPEHVHIVVAPANHAAPDLLWTRFGEAIGFDASAFDPITTSVLTNQALGAAQIAVLRKVNKALARRIKQPRYASVVKNHFAQRILAAQPSIKPTCPDGLVEILRGFAEQENKEILARGYRVHGDLAELLPVPQGGALPTPDHVAESDEIAAAVAAIAELLVERAARGPRESVQTTPAPEARPEVSLGSRVRRRLRRSQ